MKKDLTPSTAYRTLCTRCLRSSAVCYCGEIVSFPTPFKTVILQHPRERKNSIGTARLTHLCIKDSELIVGGDFENDSQVRKWIGHPDYFPVVLFPGEQSLSIEKPDVQNSLMKSDRPLLVFIIDGTWAHAKSMLRKSPSLNLLPKISFVPSQPSHYQIRRQPNPHCLSTIEAVYQMITLLDPGTKPDLLLVLFQKMVRHQIVCAERNQLRELQA